MLRPCFCASFSQQQSFPSIRKTAGVPLVVILLQQCSIRAEPQFHGRPSSCCVYSITLVFEVLHKQLMPLCVPGSRSFSVLLSSFSSPVLITKFFSVLLAFSFRVSLPSNIESPNHRNSPKSSPEGYSGSPLIEKHSVEPRKTPKLFQKGITTVL